LQSPGEVRYWLNIPELQVIPSLNTGSAGAAALKAKPSQPRFPLSIGRDQPSTRSRTRRSLSNGIPLSSPELVAWSGKPSTVTESFLSLLTSILLSGDDEDRPKVLLLTSAHPGEGKTMVASNLAVALAQINRKVLLVDADLRKPRIHGLFEVPNHSGLRNLLEDGFDTSDGETASVRETRIPGLSVLTSGPPTHSSANLLYSDKVPALMERLRQEFDMVIIDSPPMLDVPDARILGRMADAVILVTRVGHTTRDAAIAASQRFADDRIRVLGTILNDWDPRKSGQHYYYGYAHQPYSSN
jgi:capsular exopolysaccharide synthesis family protein